MSPSHSSQSPLPSQATQLMTPEEMRAIIARSTPEDYDGHTEFSRMTPAQRLVWLDQAVLFIAAQKAGEGSADSSG